MAAPGDTFLVKVNGALLGQRTITTWAVSLLSGIGADTGQITQTKIATKLNSGGQLLTLFANCCPQNWVSSSITVQQIFPRPALVPFVLPTIDEGGGAVSTVPNVSAAITRKGNVAARFNIGGIRVPLSPADCVGGMLGELVQTSLGVLATYMRTNTSDIAGTTTWAWGHIHPVGVPPNVTPVFVFTDSTEVQLTSRVMRRRTVGLGI